ncbi:MAG: RNA-binding transcriptional accessory protein, partial [Methylocystaceae bacterium]|nr:RNA-binding transcriptional accessory protein [Methylocystaceae bacterium]
MTSIVARLSHELQANSWQVQAAVDLLDEGSSVPFIARYRKEATGALDDVQLRKLEERLRYLRELDERRKAVLESIDAQGKLTDVLKKSLLEADNKARLEDIYLPFKPKRRTKAQLAIEAGLAPLAEALLASPERDPNIQAEKFIDSSKNISDVNAALEGARAILVEKFSEDADLIGPLRETYWSQCVLISKARGGKETAGVKYSDYFDFSQPIAKLPSHRILALLRGEKEEILELTMQAEPQAGVGGYERQIAQRYHIVDRERKGDRWLLDVIRWAVIDATGKIVATTAIYPHEPQRRWDDALATLTTLAREHAVKLIAIGNGTASRETDRLAQELIVKNPELKLSKIVVSEAGASVYSASEYASRELPNLDVSLRGAASIARRLQDPLAELVKIEPKAIGVGQYQHDVSEIKLSRALDAVVEDCVNAVGVDVNTASAPLLARVSGLSETIAMNIVAHRDQHGAFRSRNDLKNIPRLGPKAFEQSAGFLRIRDGDDPLDRSSVHPESYPLVRRILDALQTNIHSLIGDISKLRSIKPAQFVDGSFGLPTISDVLTGVVTNVAAFGAFVDIGVHQDGLVHISALSKNFVKDPRSVVKPGDIVRVKVMEIDAPRKRISLSMRLDDTPPSEGKKPVMTRVAAPTAKKPYSATAQADGALGALLNEA